MVRRALGMSFVNRKSNPTVSGWAIIVVSALALTLAGCGRKGGLDAPPAGAVLSVPMPGPREALAAVATAAGHGLRIGCFRPPSTPDGISRLRLTAHAHHTSEELALAVKVLRLIMPGTCG